MSRLNAMTFHDLFPARGRKHVKARDRDLAFRSDFMTSSPQGDGNNCSGCQVGCVTKIIRLRRERMIDLCEEKVGWMERENCATTSQASASS